MANNCNNWITLNGNVSEIKEFSKLLEIGENQENGYDIYTNLCNEFGKSENDGRWFDIEVISYEGEIIISGDSAWCPCLELFTKISEKYPSFEIHYEYEEGGCDFAGFADINDGLCQDNCFGYWEGKAANDYNYAFQCAFEDVEYNFEDDTEEDFIKSDMYLAFQPDEQKELLEEFKKMKSNLTEEEIEIQEIEKIESDNN